MKLSSKEIADFQSLVLQKGKELYRPMPWRDDYNSYYILLSEIMLQQTQVPRVRIKFAEFIEKFPTLESLADADFQEVLACWSGLGYNRRARYLHQAIQQIHTFGRFPQEYSQLLQLPGIGPNTAASILVYAFNQPLVFVETNIRTVLIYTFFSDTTEKIGESVMQNLIEQTMYKENPRQWYWALMDYGFYIKKTEGNFNRLSKMHTTQSKFEGSNRQKRAQFLRFLLQFGPHSAIDISQKLGIDNSLTLELLQTLLKDSLVREENGVFLIG